jgi:hypothetical protein
VQRLGPPCKAIARSPLSPKLARDLQRSRMKILVVIFLVVILASLGSALYYLIRDKGASDRTVKALTLRIVLSIVLFVLLMAGYYSGLIAPAGL